MVKQVLTLSLFSLIVVACGGGGGGGTGSFSVSSTVVGSQMVGQTGMWIAQGGSVTAAHKFSVGKVGEPLRVIYDFSLGRTFEWTPLEEGDYIVAVDARDAVGGVIQSISFEVTVEPFATTDPVVLPTSNPLVALFGAPPCIAGQSVRVLFRPVGGTDFDFTNWKPCTPGQSTNFYIAGMMEDTTYEMFHEILPTVRSERVLGPQVLFNTGTIPPEATFPTRTVVAPLTASSSAIDDVVLHTTFRGPPGVSASPFASNLTGEIIWYVEELVASPGGNLNRSVTGGSVLHQTESMLREFDLGGHVIRQTTVDRVNEQLLAIGEDLIIAFHHELRRLPNGYTVTLGYVERLFQDVQGAVGIVDILADMIIVLDEDFQLAWTWNAFDHLDINRPSISTPGAGTCTGGQGGCPPRLDLADIANDWMHSNAVGYSPSDGNLILSVRHQDWVVKVDYRDGIGTGAVVWRLGADGDFTLNSMDPSPWFSHQHDSNYTSGNRISLYDNGNTRVSMGGGNSRGQVYELDETMMTATAILNADLGAYSPAVGSAQILSNGNYHFDSGFLNPPVEPFSIGDEVLPDGTLDFGLQVDSGVYRSFRMPDLYTPPLGTH